MPKRRALYTITPPDPQTDTSAPGRVSESSSSFSYTCTSPQPIATNRPRRKARRGRDEAQTTLAFEEDQEATAPPAEPHYTITPGWIDCSHRTRTWKLLDPFGNPRAEIATKRDAAYLADLLNELLHLRPERQSGPPDPSP